MPMRMSTRYEYDAMGRQTAVINATGHRTQSVYDLAGRKITGDRSQEARSRNLPMMPWAD